MPSPPPLRLGHYVLLLVCPTCGQGQETAVYLGTRVTADDSGAQVRATLSSRAVDHICGQIHMAAGPPDEDSDDVGTRPMDFREASAGES